MRVHKASVPCAHAQHRVVCTIEATFVLSNVRNGFQLCLKDPEAFGGVCGWVCDGSAALSR